MTDKKFYWIKLKTDFFNRNDIDFLLSQQNGCQYVVLYQMLCLSTANNEGKLFNKIGEVIVPYNAEKIVRDCKYFDIDTVNVAMSLYRKMGLVYEEEDGTLRISNYDELVGSETKWADYKRKQKKLEKVQSDSKLLPNKVQQEKDIDNRDKSIENREEEKEEELEIEVINDKSLKPKQLESEFETIWKLYPRKNSKKDALRHYMVARKNGTEYQDVLDGLYRYLDYIKSQKIDPRYIKHGSTWFNQESWNDEYVKTPPRTLKDISFAEIEEAIKRRREREGIVDEI